MAKTQVEVTTEDQTTATSADTSASPTSNETQQLYAEQVKLLYMYAPIGLIASLVNSAILTFIQWKLISHSVAMTWFACIVLITLLRSVLVYRYRGSSVAVDKAGQWEAWFIISDSIFNPPLTTPSTHRPLLP